MATNNWNVATGSYSVGSNWSLGVPPTASDTAVFGAGTGTISGTGVAATLNIAALGNWSFSGQVAAGAMNDLGNVTILNGGVLTSTSSQFGVGNAVNATGTLAVNAGGKLLSTIPAQTSLNELTVANYNGSTGTVTVSGTGALINMGANGAGIGNFGNGTLTVSNGGTVQLATSNSTLLAALSAGNNAGSQASITVTGASSTISVAGYVYIGRAGSANLTVSNGGTFTGGAAGTTNGQAISIGDGTFASSTSTYFGGTATADVTGAGSTLHSLNQLRVGYRGTSGSLTVEQGGAARADTNVTIGGGTDRVGGTGTLLVQTGGTVTAGGAHITGSAGIVFGNDAGTTGTGTVTGSGSLLNANGDRLTIGGSGTGSLTISGGGRATAGSAGYSDVEAALAVAGGEGATGSVLITGAGSALVATGDGVIGGNEKGAGPYAGGTGTVTVASGGTLSVSGTLTVEAGSTLSVDSSSALLAPNVVVNGGAVTLGVLTSANAFSFGAGGSLAVSAVSGSNTVSNFGFGDAIDLLGTTGATLSGTTVTTGTGTITLNAAPANASYSLISDGNGGTEVVVSPQTIGVYRFFDTAFGTHFYTASAEEARTAAARPDLIAEGPGGIGLQAVAVQASDPNATAVYRFFDNVHGTHFFTASATERDTVIANRTDLVYEASSTFYEHTTQQPGDTAVYRFFDTKYGTHFYTDSESERANIVANRSDLTAEGIGFYEPKQNYAT